MHRSEQNVPVCVFISIFCISQRHKLLEEKVT